MQQKKIGYVVANFGGPRHLLEIEPFLKELLTDRDVIHTNFPKIVHRFLFSRVAKKRTKKVTVDYQSIGGKSPIYEDTEAVAECLRQHLKEPLITFHRYLQDTHAQFIKKIHQIPCDEIRVFPMFPQFTYATTGSIARWFRIHLQDSLVNKMRWIKSYPAHPAFVLAHQNAIKHYLKHHHLKEEETVLLFSAHGIPQKFMLSGDVYEDECQASFKYIMKAFPKTLGRLSYQSKFGRDEWLRPYTNEVCEAIKTWNQGRSNIVFIPVSFTSDHIETLFEIENDYMTIIKQQGLSAHRVPALTLDPNWIQAILDILLKETNLCSNQMLIRKN